MSRRPLPGYVKLLLCMFTIWLLLWVITPLWVPYSKLHQDFAAAQEKYDVLFRSQFVPVCFYDIIAILERRQ